MEPAIKQERPVLAKRKRPPRKAKVVSFDNPRALAMSEELKIKLAQLKGLSNQVQLLETEVLAIKKDLTHGYLWPEWRRMENEGDEKISFKVGEIEVQKPCQWKAIPPGKLQGLIDALGHELLSEVVWEKIKLNKLDTAGLIDAFPEAVEYSEEVKHEVVPRHEPKESIINRIQRLPLTAEQERLVRDVFQQVAFLPKFKVEK